jgi:hypothetical protein
MITGHRSSYHAAGYRDRQVSLIAEDRGRLQTSVIKEVSVIMDDQ